MIPVVNIQRTFALRLFSAKKTSSATANIQNKYWNHVENIEPELWSKRSGIETDDRKAMFKMQRNHFH